MPKERLTLYDSRALLESPAAPASPDEAASVQAALASPGLRLTLLAEKHIKAYSAWLWEGNDGQGYFSKKFPNGKTLAWKAGATAERVLNANPSMKRREKKA